jgi:hypothetical protein
MQMGFFDLEATQRAACESLRGKIQSEMKLQTSKMLQKYFPSLLKGISDFVLECAPSLLNFLPRHGGSNSSSVKIRRIIGGFCELRSLQVEATCKRLRKTNALMKGRVSDFLHFVKNARARIAKGSLAFDANSPVVTAKQLTKDLDSMNIGKLLEGHSTLT